MSNNNQNSFIKFVTGVFLATMAAFTIGAVATIALLAGAPQGGVVTVAVTAFATFVGLLGFALVNTDVPK